MITWESNKEQIFEMPTGGAAIMRKGPNLLKLARKEQCLALTTQLRNKFKVTPCFYRVYPSGEVQYLHPKDGVYPEKVNAGRQGVNQNFRRIGDNVNPIKVGDGLCRQLWRLNCCSSAGGVCSNSSKACLQQCGGLALHMVFKCSWPGTSVSKHSHCAISSCSPSAAVAKEQRHFCRCSLLHRHTAAVALSVWYEQSTIFTGHANGNLGTCPNSSCMRITGFSVRMLCCQGP